MENTEAKVPVKTEKHELQRRLDEKALRLAREEMKERCQRVVEDLRLLFEDLGDVLWQKKDAAALLDRMQNVYTAANTRTAEIDPNRFPNVWRHQRIEVVDELLKAVDSVKDILNQDHH